jgi:uncharacterized protein with PIN domain
MTRARELEKARLVRQAERLIEEMLDWQEATDRPDLTQIEGKILELRQRFGQELALYVIEAQQTKRPVPGPKCKQCGQEMSYKGQKEVTPRTWLDKVRYERGYYYCKRCGVGFFPSG